jgi:hypothetical protein
MAINFYFIYGVILFLILTACLLIDKDQKKNNYILLFSLFLVFIFMAFRKNFTPDYGLEGYEGLFNTIHAYGYDKDLHSEIGYQWLNIILPSYRSVIVITSLLFCSALFFLFKRYISPKYWAFAFVVLFIDKSMLLGNTSGVRNSIAVSAFIFGFYFLQQNKKIMFTIILIIASFFHTSSLFFIPFVFINSNRLSRRKIQLLWVIIILFVLLTTFFQDIINISSLWLISNIGAFSGYETYIDTKQTFGFRGLSFLLIFFMFYMNINALKNRKLSNREVLLIKLSLLYYFLMLLPGIGLISRLYFYLSFPQLAGNIYVLRRINEKPFRWAYILGMLIIPLMEFYAFSLSDNFKEFYLNYHSVLLN